MSPTTCLRDCLTSADMPFRSSQPDEARFQRRPRGEVPRPPLIAQRAEILVATAPSHLKVQTEDKPAGPLGGSPRHSFPPAGARTGQFPRGLRLSTQAAPT